jgi:hypothetical protein
LDEVNLSVDESTICSYLLRCNYKKKPVQKKKRQFHMKPRRVTALQHWMLETGRTDIALSHEINGLRSGNKAVNARQIARWRKGLAQPRPWALKLLATMSDGKVDANSFVEAMA